MIKILMDGPNVNWKMVKIAKKYHKKRDPDAPSLIEMGSCGLHVFHGAYKTATIIFYIMEFR